MNVECVNQAKASPPVWPSTCILVDRQTQNGCVDSGVPHHMHINPLLVCELFGALALMSDNSQCTYCMFCVCLSVYYQSKATPVDSFFLCWLL